MTFIASVVARRGAALIADSLVTTSRATLDFDDFYQYLAQKKKETGEGEIKIDHAEVIGLFRMKPSHTKDYQEKLFKYDSHTAVLIAGAADLNGKNLGEIITNASLCLSPSIEIEIEKRVEDLRAYLEMEVRQAIEHDKKVRFAVLIVTSYSPASHQSAVYRIYINETQKEDLENPDFIPVRLMSLPQNMPVVCEGQNRISENILFGAFNSLYEAIPRVAQKIFKDFGIQEDKIPADYVENLFRDSEIMTPEFWTISK